MKHRKLIVCVALLISFAPGSARRPSREPGDKLLSYIVDPREQDIRFFWKNDSGAVFGNIGKLKEFLEHRHRTLIFAMNGGMFKADFSPV
jgi:uncharacterized protein YigE (DUF2233 family)